DDGLLDLDSGDVFAAADDDVLFAVADFDVAVGVHDGEVAGVVPAAGEGALGGLGVGVVALHDGVAAHDDLAHGLAVAGDVVHGVGGGAGGVDAEVGDALAGGEAGLLVVGEGIPFVVPGADGDGGVGLGGAVEVDGVEVEVAEAAEEGG